MMMMRMMLILMLMMMMMMLMLMLTSSADATATPSQPPAASMVLELPATMTEPQLTAELQVTEEPTGRSLQCTSQRDSLRPMPMPMPVLHDDDDDDDDVHAA